MQAYALGSRNQKILMCIIKLLESRRNLEILEFLMPTRGMLKIWENSDIRNIGIPTTRFWLELNKMQTHPERKKNIAREVIQNTNACKKRRNMAALPTGKHFDLTESQKELLKKLQEALVCCDPLTQGTCSWSKFASNVRWPTLSFSCQKQEKCLLLFHSRRAKSIHCDHFWKVCKTAEGGRDAAVLTLYKSRGETESWKRCVWREHMSNGLSWAMHEGFVPTAALILWLGLSNIATPQLHVLSIASGDCCNCIDTSQIMYAQHQRPGMPLMTACCKR